MRFRTVVSLLLSWFVAAGSHGFDVQNPIGPKLSAATRGMQIAENPRWVEVRSYAGNAEKKVLGTAMGRTVTQPDWFSQIHGGSCGLDNRRSGMTLPNPYVPKISGCVRSERRNDVSKHFAHHSHVVIGSMRALPFDAQRCRKGFQTVAGQDERSARHHEGVQEKRKALRQACSGEFRFEKRHVPFGRVRHENSTVDHIQEILSNLRKCRGQSQRFSFDPVDVRVAMSAIVGSHECRQGGFEFVSTNAFGTHFDHAIDCGPKPGHLEVEEHERRVTQGIVPR